MTNDNVEYIQQIKELIPDNGDYLVAGSGARYLVNAINATNEAEIDAEINAEFSESEPFDATTDFQAVLNAVDSLEDSWKAAGLYVLADAATQFTNTIRRWVKEQDEIAK